MLSGMRDDSNRRRRTRSEIQELIEGYCASGQTQREFAEGHGIGVSTLSKWIRREKDEGNESARPRQPRLVEVSLMAQEPDRPAAAADFEVEFRSGERLLLRRGFLAQELGTIVAVLRGEGGR